MAITKRGLRISLPKSDQQFLEALAKRDKVSVGTKATQLLVDEMEDIALSQIADARDIPHAKTMGGDDFWKAAFKNKLR